MKTYVIDAGVLILYFIGDKRVKPYMNEILGKSASRLNFSR